MRTHIAVLFSILCFTICLFPTQILGQSANGNVLFGDIKVDEGDASELKPISIEIVLYNLSGYPIARQTIGNNGRYRFINLADGEYDVVVIMENSEVARLRVQLRSPIYSSDFRQDIDLEWKAVNRPSKPNSVSVEDFYTRSAVNEKRFQAAQSAIDNKRYEEALNLLKKLLADDANDFQATTELGTVYLVQQDAVKAEQSYAEALAMRPRFFPALLNLGRLKLMENKLDEAVAGLCEAVAVKPNSAEANYYLGEAYLQIKKGSKAVGYLYAALKLDPIGHADAHLRLAVLFNGAGMKDKASIEYEEYLKKKPDYHDRRTLEQYIKANKSKFRAAQP
ncbi:MAG: tetratricopeptide repeat protein [Pyrinomonadaceae bacterium]